MYMVYICKHGHGLDVHFFKLYTFPEFDIAQTHKLTDTQKPALT